jgi:four helix bundle protein
MNAYRRLKAWQRCRELALEVYRATRAFPPDERYGLRSQARRAAFSAPANIAEGSCRRGARQFAHFLDASIGSLGELSYVFDIAGDLGYLSPHALTALRELHSHAARLTWRLYEYQRRKANG